MNDGGDDDVDGVLFVVVLVGHSSEMGLLGGEEGGEVRGGDAFWPSDAGTADVCTLDAGDIAGPTLDGGDAGFWIDVEAGAGVDDDFNVGCVGGGDFGGDGLGGRGFDFLLPFLTALPVDRCIYRGRESLLLGRLLAFRIVSMPNFTISLLERTTLLFKPEVQCSFRLNNARFSRYDERCI